MEEDKIIEAIKMHLENKTKMVERWDSKMVEIPIEWPINVDELASDIAKVVLDALHH